MDDSVENHNFTIPFENLLPADPENRSLLGISMENLIPPVPLSKREVVFPFANFESRSNPKPAFTEESESLYDPEEFFHPNYWLNNFEHICLTAKEELSEKGIKALQEAIYDDTHSPIEKKESNAPNIVSGMKGLRKLYHLESLIEHMKGISMSYNKRVVLQCKDKTDENSEEWIFLEAPKKDSGNFIKSTLSDKETVTGGRKKSGSDDLIFLEAPDNDSGKSLKGSLADKEAVTGGGKKSGSDEWIFLEAPEKKSGKSQKGSLADKEAIKGGKKRVKKSGSALLDMDAELDEPDFTLEFALAEAMEDVDSSDLEIATDMQEGQHGEMAYFDPVSMKIIKMKA